MDKRLLLPTSVAQVVVKWDLVGQVCESIMYVKHQHRDTEFGIMVAADFNVDNATYVAGVFKSWLQTHWAPIAHTKAAATEVDIIWNTIVGTGPLEGRVFQDTDYPIPGTIVGAALPNNVTIAVEMRTDLLGRSFHGRTYFVGAAESISDPAVDVNVITAPALAQLVDTFEALRTSLASMEFSTGGVPDAINDNFPLHVVSYVSDKTLRAEAVATPVTACTVSDPFLDSMRRRLPGHNRRR